jgi:hypothetical protein
MCGQVFPMPRVVRIPCSRCRHVLRVPAEMIGREVACKFCDQTFRADPGRILSRDPSVSAPRPLADDTFLDASEYVVPPASGVGIAIARAEFPRSRPEEKEPSERIRGLEQSLDRIVAEHKELQVELRRVRDENETLLRAEREEIEQFRGQLVRLEQIRDVIERGQGRSRQREQASRQWLQPASARHAVPANGHSRIVSARSLQRPGAVTRAHPGHRGGGVALREALSLLATCERMADRLVTELKTTQQERDQERATFERILEQLQDDLTRARSELETARAQAHPAHGPAAGPEGQPGPPAADSTGAAE